MWIFIDDDKDGIMICGDCEYTSVGTGTFSKLNTYCLGCTRYRKIVPVLNPFDLLRTNLHPMCRCSTDIKKDNEWGDEATPIEDLKKALDTLQDNSPYTCPCNTLSFPHNFICPLCGTLQKRGDNNGARII